MSTARARKFVIWRAATNVDWDCTVRDLSDETGISVATVRHICAKAGWRLLSGHHSRDKNSLNGRPPLTELFREQKTSSARREH